jgi:hypothetical protein
MRSKLLLLMATIVLFGCSKENDQEPALVTSEKQSSVNRSDSFPSPRTMTINLDGKVTLQSVASQFIEGNLYENMADQKMYWMVNGRLHHIESWDTYLYLFRDGTNWIQVTNFEQAIFLGPPFSTTALIGNPIPLGTRLVYCPNGNTYIYAGYFSYLIPNPATFNYYRLDWNSSDHWQTNPAPYMERPFSEYQG